MTCEHETGGMIFYTDKMSVSLCTWGCVVVGVIDDNDITHEFTPAEILAMRGEIAAARLIIDALLHDKPTVDGQSTVEAGLRWLGVTR